MAAHRRYPAPRWQTPLPPDVVGSWGPDVIALAESVLGIRLDRWQRRALNRALAYGRDGRLVHRVYLVSTGRQNGKTTIVRALVIWFLTGAWTPEGWRLAYGLAHDKAQARIPYAAIADDLRPVAARVGPLGRGGLALTRYLGLRSAMFGRAREYRYGSSEARDSLRGESVDLGIFDEIRTQRTYDTWAALQPTTRARPDPLIFGISSAGDERSVLLRDWFDRGRRIIDGAEPAAGFGMTWYAPPDEADPNDPRAHILANPSIADGRLDPRVVAQSFYDLGPAAFRMETLNLWSDAADEWLPAGGWRAAIGDAIAREGARCVLGVEAVPSWRRATVTVALSADDRAYVGVAGELDASRTAAATVPPAELVALLDRLAGEWKPSAVAFSGAAAAAPYVTTWAEGHGVAALALNARQIRSASELFRSEIIGGRLAHPDDPLLAQQSRVARPSSPIEAGGWYFGIRQSTGEIDAIRAAAWASWAAIAPEAAVIVPELQIFL